MLEQITVRVELGPYVLVGREVEHCEVFQSVGDHVRCELGFLRDPAAVASPVAALRLAELAGAALRVTFLADGGATAHLAFAGRVREAEIEHLATGAGAVTVVALSDSYVLAEHADRRYFREHTPAALAGVFGLAVAGALPGGAARDYVQAGVSGWTFLGQVAAEDGLQLRARWPRTPDGAAGEPAELGHGFADETHPVTWGRELLRLTTALAPVNAGVTGAFYDPAAKHDHRFRGVRAPVEWLGGAKPVVAAARAAATRDADGGDPGHLEVGRVAGGRARTQEEFRARLELASARRLGSTVQAHGVSVDPALRAGDRIDVQAAPTLMGTAGDGEVDDRTGTFGLIAVTHRWTGTLYENAFEATPWAAYHPTPEGAAARGATSSGPAPASTSVPGRGGDFVLGVVVTVGDPKGMGRVRVRLAWMGEGETTAWVRVAGLGGGNGRGVGVLPSVGDEVVVAAVAGDPEHLVILGGLWNGVDQAGHAPGRQHWVTPAGNTLSFVEGKPGEDQETVELHTKQGKAWVQLAQKGPTGVPTVTVHSEGDLSLEAPNGELRLSAKSYVAHVAGEHATQAGAHTVKSGGAVTVESGARLAMQAGGDVALRAGGPIKVHGAGGQTLTGATLALNPAGATAPVVTASVPAVAPSAWSPRAVPGPGPGRSTEDPKTPTRSDLAQRSASASMSALAAAPVAAPAAASAVRVHGPDAGQESAPGLPLGVASPVVDCGSAWAKYLGEADAVLAQGGGDPFERNRAISATYAEVFLSDPARRFRWLGAGAFASKQVGCGIFDAQEMERHTNALDPRHPMAARAAQKLAEGNAAVFRDIVPAHRMYQEHGIDGIRRCGPARPGGSMDPQMVLAFEDMDRGGERDLRASAARMVQYEQNDVLQVLVFDDADTATMLRRNQMAQNVANGLPEPVSGVAQQVVSAAGSRPMRVAFSADCSGPYALEFTGTDPANPAQRVPYAQAVVRSFSDQIAAGAAPRATTEAALRQLVGRHPYRSRP